MSIWERLAFPTRDLQRDFRFYANGAQWLAARHTINSPLCFTPTEEFSFGGKRFIPLYPCAAFATKSFGFVVQKTWEGLTYGRE